MGADQTHDRRDKSGLFVFVSFVVDLLILNFARIPQIERLSDR